MHDGDLRKAGLLEALLQFPDTLVMPDTLFEAEWLSLGAPLSLNAFVPVRGSLDCVLVGSFKQSLVAPR